MNAYQKITDAILAAMRDSNGNWQRPWVGRLVMPSNGVTGRRYRGSNVVGLWAAGQRGGYPDARWATFRQWATAGATVRRGEKGTPVIFFRMLDRNGIDAEGETDDAPGKIPMARLSYVFNTAQVDGLPAEPAQPTSVADIAAVDAMVQASGAVIRHGGNQACYSPTSDTIMLPCLSDFRGTATSSATEAYYGVLLHELTHWTGPRLQRDFGKRFGDDAYAAEELVAELGAAFLCAELGVAIEPRQDHAEYLAHWFRMLQHDAKAFTTAASKAAQAADYLLAFRQQRQEAA